MSSMDCKIYYGDGSTFEGPPRDAPPINVQCIALADGSASNYNVGRLILHSWDFYLYGKGRWYGINGYTDLVDHLLFEEVEKVLKGRVIPNSEYQKILSLANNDLKLPRKSGRNSIVEDGRQ